MDFYRTYIIKFSTSVGTMYYAGKRKSKHKDPSDDPYTGSGTIISRAIKKYGKSCVDEIKWFEHTKDTVAEEEKILISKVRTIHGEMCVNLADGGCGGDTYRNLTKEEKIDIKRRRTESFRMTAASDEFKIRASNTQRLVQNRPEVRLKKSKAISKTKRENPDIVRMAADKQKLTNQSPETKERRSSAQKEAQNRPDVIWRTSESNKKTHRVGLHWDLYFSGELDKLWEESGRVGYTKFKIWIECNTHHVITASLRKVVKALQEDYMIND